MIYPPDYSSGGLFLGLLGHFSILHFSHPISQPLSVDLFINFFIAYTINSIIAYAAMTYPIKNAMSVIFIVPDIIFVYSFRFLLNYTSNIVEVQAWIF